MFGFQPLPRSSVAGGDPPGDCEVLSTSSYAAASGTSHSITMPSGVVSGDTIAIAIAYKDYLAPPTGFTGFTLLRTEYLDGTSSRGVLRTYTKVSDGTEGSSLVVTTSSSTSVVAVAARVTCEHSGSGSSSSGSGDTATSSAPSPSVGHDVLQMLAIAWIDGRAVETYPSDYLEDYVTNSTGGSGSSLVISFGWKTVSGASETPGDISIDDDVDWATAVEVFG